MNRRGFLGGLVAAVAAPAIVRAGALMPVRVIPSAMTATEILARQAALDAMVQMHINAMRSYLLDVTRATEDALLYGRGVLSTGAEITFEDLYGPTISLDHVPLERMLEEQDRTNADRVTLVWSDPDPKPRYPFTWE